MHKWQRLALGAIVVVSMSLATTAPVQATITPNWINATTDTGSPGDFDTGTLTFPAQSTSQIFVGRVFDADYHDHGNGCSALVEARLNGIWTLVYTSPVSNGADLPLASFPSPLATFPTASFDGIRLSSTCFVGNAYHSFGNRIAFATDGGAFGENIPTMSEWGLLALMSLMLVAGGLAVRRAPGR
jgi:hypothetical protein